MRLLPSSWDSVSVSIRRIVGPMRLPSGRSFWTLSGSPSLLHHPTLVALAQSASCTPAQVIFRLAQMRGIVPLAGSTNEDRMKHGIDASRVNLELAPGSEKAIQSLNDLISGQQTYNNV